MARTYLRNLSLIALGLLLGLIGHSVEMLSMTPVSLSASPSSGTAPLSVTLSASGTLSNQACEGGYLEFHFGDGSPSYRSSDRATLQHRATVGHTYSNPGSYTASVDLYCAGFAMVESSDSVTIRVTAVSVSGDTSPHITSLSPSTGAPGTLVNISGSNFSSRMSNNRVTVGGNSAPIVGASESSIQFTVPQLTDGVYQVRVTRFGTSLLQKGSSKSAQGGSSNPLEFEVSSGSEQRSITEQDIDNGFMIGEVLIFFEPNATAAQRQQVLQDFDLKLLQNFEFLGLSRAELKISSVAETLSIIPRLNQDPRVQRAFLNAIHVTTQSDPLVGEQEWLSNIGLPLGWFDFFPNRGAGTVIAIIDSGIDLDLPTPVNTEFTLYAGAPQGLNFTPDQSSDPTANDVDFRGHGTSVSGIATARSDNGVQGSGVASLAAVLPMRVFQQGQFRTPVSNSLWIAEAIATAYQMEVDVINMSFRDASSTQTVDGVEVEIERYYELLFERIESSIREEERRTGIPVQRPVIVASTGNDGADSVGCPACHPFVIAVGSATFSDDTWQRSSFSNYGSGIDLVAQGEGIVTTQIRGNFDVLGPGTSFSAPQVAGMAALIRAERPTLTPTEVKNLILKCFVQDIGAVGYDLETGWGRLFIPRFDDVSAACDY